MYCLIVNQKCCSSSDSCFCVDQRLYAHFFHPADEGTGQYCTFWQRRVMVGVEYWMGHALGCIPANCFFIKWILDIYFYFYILYRFCLLHPVTYKIYFGSYYIFFVFVYFKAYSRITSSSRDALAYYSFSLGETPS